MAKAFTRPDFPKTDFPKTDCTKTLSRAAVRELDRCAVEDYGIPSLILMENAALNLSAEVVIFLGELGASSDARVAIVCGGGNNGGDGLVLARQLHNRGYRPKILYLARCRDARGDAAVNLAIVEKMGLDFELCLSSESLAAELKDPSLALICDAYLGTGLATPLRGEAIARIEEINRAELPRLAVDIPSGLDCDSGRPLGAAVRAARTVTMAAVKRGFPQASDYTGELRVVDIGVPREVLEAAYAADS